MKVTQLIIIVSILILVLTLLEIFYCLYKKNGFYTFQDSVTSFGTLALAHCANIATIYPLTTSYEWIYNRFALFHFEMSWWSVVLCYIGCDLGFYTFHRSAHRINIFWAAHIAHHTSEEFNLVVAFRGSITQRAISFLFYWPLCVLGFTTDTVITVIGINLALLALTHTRVVKRFPRWFEAVFVTPYHHQVHHAINPIYWDKNFGGTFVFWDKLFGTYQNQTEPIYYGVSAHPQSWDPINLNFFWFKHIFKNFITTKKWSNKFKILFYPASFRAPDLPLREEAGDSREYSSKIKYSTSSYTGSRPYIIFQMVMVFILLVPIVNPHSFMDSFQKTLMSALVFFHVYSIALFLEGRKNAHMFEVLRYVLLCSFFFSLPKNDKVDFFQILVTISSLISLSYLIFLMDKNKKSFVIQKTQVPDPLINN